MSPTIRSTVSKASTISIARSSAVFRRALSYLIIGRGPGSPIGLTFSVTPEWSRVDGTSGLRTRDFSTEFRLIADTEIIPNRLYAAVNALYQPDVAKASGDLAWSRTATGGVTGRSPIGSRPR